MAVIKIACPKCGQKVSGDETFYGRSVNCPICTSKILFPDPPAGQSHSSLPSAIDQLPSAEDPLPPAVDPLPPANQTFDAGTPPSMTPEPAAAEPVPPVSDPALESLPQPDPPAVIPPPTFDEAPVQSYGAGMPPVPAAPEIIVSDEDDEVPSPLLGSIALVVGILNVVTLCIPGIVLAPISIVLGHMALAKAKRSPVQPAPGQSLAMIGVILGYAGVVFTIIVLIILLVAKEPFLEWWAAQQAEAA